MKRLLRYTLLSVFCLLTINAIWGNLSWGTSLLNLIIVAFVLAIFELVLKPILKILLLPISILTLGLIRVVIDTVGLYLAVALVPDFSIANVYTTTFVQNGFSVPALTFEGFFAYLVTSFTFNIVYNLFNFILKRKSV